MKDETKQWLRKMGPVLGVVVLVGAANFALVLRLHGEGSKNDVPPLKMPLHYVLQVPDRAVPARFDDSCLRLGWAKLAPDQTPSFAAGVDRERALGDLPVVGAKGVLRVSIREPQPFPSALQIEFLGEPPREATHPAATAARRTLATLDEACGVAYVAPSECGALTKDACRAFRVD